MRIAEALFEREQRPMSARELVHRALGLHMLESGGETPWQTMKAKLSVEIRRNGEASVFVRTAPGQFYLRRLLLPTDQVFDAKPLTPPLSHERVLVFDTRKLQAVARFQGVVREWETLLPKLLALGPNYMDRLDAEQDDQHKQMLTYVMVTRGSEVLVYERGAYNRVEDFLRGLSCVGFGGHVRAEDHDLTSVADFGILRSAARELAEELQLPARDAARLESFDGLRVVGLLNDDSSSVGRRHFAVILRYDIDERGMWDDPRRGEKSIKQLRWMDVASQELRLERFEYWSQLCLRAFFDSAVQGRAAYLIRRPRPVRPPHLLAVLGEIGSGKTEAASCLRQDFGYAEVNSGAIVAELLGRPALTPERETDRIVFQEQALEFIRSDEGPRILASRIWEAALSAGTDRVLVDGVRQHATLAALRSGAGAWGVGLLYVYTPPDVAFAFYRFRRGRQTVMQDFIRVREATVEQEVADMIRDADAVLYNWRGKRGFRDIVRALMKELGVSRR